MRWDDLFADLVGQWEAQARWEAEEEIRELAHAEMAATTFADRVRARRSHQLTVRVSNGQDYTGTVRDVSSHWIVLADGHRRHLIPIAAMVAAWPLAGSAPPARGVERALGLGHVLRALARDGQPVVARTAGGDHRGRLVRIGGDHLDNASETGVVTIAWAGRLCVSSR
ncbi:MAG: hypothetical protein ACK5KU_07990 [Beutenbergiaceae bacterium]